MLKLRRAVSLKLEVLSNLMLTETLALVSTNQKKYGRAQKLVKTSELTEKLRERYDSSPLLLNFLTKVKFEISYQRVSFLEGCSSLGGFINIEELKLLRFCHNLPKTVL